MAKHDVMSLAIRFLGLLLILSILPVVPTLLTPFIAVVEETTSSPIFPYAIAITFARPLLATTAGLLLIVTGGYWSQRLFADAGRKESIKADAIITKEDLLVYILFGVGFWVAVHALDKIIRTALHIPLVREMGMPERAGVPSVGDYVNVYRITVAGAGLQLAVALIMVLRGRKIARWIERIQRALHRVREEKVPAVVEGRIRDTDSQGEGNEP